MQAGGIVCIGVAERNAHKLVAFDLNNASGKFLRNRRVRIDLAREALGPERIENLFRSLPPHDGDDVW